MNLFEFRISPAAGETETRLVPCEDFNAASQIATHLSAQALEVQVWSDGACRARFYPGCAAAAVGEPDRSFAPSQAPALSDADAVALWTVLFGQAPPVAGPAALLLSIMARHAPARPDAPIPGTAPRH